MGIPSFGDRTAPTQSRKGRGALRSPGRGGKVVGVTLEEFAALQVEAQRRLGMPLSQLSQVIRDLNRATARLPTNEQFIRAFASALRRQGYG